MKKIFRTIILMLLCLCFPVLHIQAAQPDMSALPSHEDWNGEEPWVFVNDGVPYFDEDDITTEPFENYSDLDKLKRCGQAFANISPDTMESIFLRRLTCMMAVPQSLALSRSPAILVLPVDRVKLVRLFGCL